MGSACVFFPADGDLFFVGLFSLKSCQYLFHGDSEQMPKTVAQRRGGCKIEEKKIPNIYVVKARHIITQGCSAHPHTDSCCSFSLPHSAVPHTVSPSHLMFYLCIKIKNSNKNLAHLKNSPLLGIWFIMCICLITKTPKMALLSCPWFQLAKQELFSTPEITIRHNGL